MIITLKAPYHIQLSKASRIIEDFALLHKLEFEELSPYTPAQRYHALTNRNYQIPVQANELKTAIVSIGAGPKRNIIRATRLKLPTAVSCSYKFNQY